MEKVEEMDEVVMAEIQKSQGEYKPLAKVEELEEANYNMIDNVLNNMPPKKEPYLEYFATECDEFKLWDEFYQIENKFGYSRELVDYLKQSSDLLPELIQGKEDPLNILFPKGEMDPALAAYHDNQINKMLNDIAKAEIGFLCREKNQNKKRTFRILEVGAGVGGTSLDVIPSLDGMEVEYYFTDLSTFFLNRAQDNFGKNDWVKYGIFDINKEFAIQGYDEFSFDLILCANVLHNSRNIHDVMENLKGCLN